MIEGFITADGYGAIPFGKKQLMIIFDNQQLEVVNTKFQAEKYIKQHRSNPKSGTVFIEN